MPEVADSAAASGTTRKERFRQYFHAFNPTVSPEQALTDGFVLTDLRPELFHKKIAARVELEPRSRQALIGGIGSGKTTELLLVQKHLAEQGISAFYVEVSRFADISRAKPGFLVGIAAKHLIRELGSMDALADDANAINNFLYGYWQHESERVYDEEPHDPYYSFVGGVIAKPIISDNIDQTARQAFERILAAYRKGRQFSLIIDGLDRMHEIDDFRRLVFPDLSIFQTLEVPVVCVAPLALQFAPQSDLREQFDRIHELSSIRTNGNGLGRVLKLRDTAGLLTSTAGIEVISGSGGLVRDLITLARDAGEEAYVSGSQQIENNHVAGAVRQMGLSYSRGLSHRQLELLRATAENKGVDPTDSEIMQLLGSRRIIEYSSTSFAVHPALSKVLNLDRF